MAKRERKELKAAKRAARKAAGGDSLEAIDPNADPMLDPMLDPMIEESPITEETGEN